MNRSNSVAALAAALAKAQGELGGAKKDSNNPAFNSKYADLASVVDAIKLCFPKNGLSYIQTPITNDKDEVGVATLLMHSSGEWIEGLPFFMPVAKANAHGFGSILTYARRYSLAAMAGVAPEDDDANEGVKVAPIRPNTARQVAVDEFDSMPPEAQAVLRDWAVQVTAFVEEGLVAEAASVAAQCETQEDKLALWSLLPSKVRSALKKHNDERKAA